ncbi:alkaline phosphatase family protein [Paenibacillus hexagrammi]|uniref:Acid phosphatase n=1 Tax=Paenibacillus hexagrammi TaxID=2908839 RepID=A0ABY3SRP8_9BACL|nr:alkaline phosphatase family protein [Paenibacillus sp. YPD9-1]UJF35652.1 acid phosphatase [Paenibacillus sp. YPD9-1]
MLKFLLCLSSFLLFLTACSQTDAPNQAQPTPAKQTQSAPASSPTSTKQPSGEAAPAAPISSSKPAVPSHTPASTTPATTQTKSSGLPKPEHVVIVVEENHSFDKVIGNKSAPYMNALTQQGAFFTQSFAMTHPSQPNYLILYSGSDQGVKDDSCGHTFGTDNLGSELLNAKLSFGGYSEDLPSVGSTVCTNHQYGRKHSPWVDFSNVPKEWNMPLQSFPTEDFSKLPTISYVIPNLDHDMHDGTINAADNWLKLHLDPYIQWAKNHNSLVILTWDEDDSSKKNHIPTLFVGPMVVSTKSDQPITHLNVLRTLEDMYNLPYAGKSGDVEPITGVWK